ncbi:hypothetical protein CH302_01050 [Rhodococcus sp. 15-2388-1-1a]|uniref:hypothetical protein n=1 Tax=Nocardiaceae TaxID=85025 RepID=UPI000564D917|nr:MULTISPECIES: hypothetical protein [Rhodococcus]OZF05241.1 hypothetical protein CH302_01050 [Rhodococcus sp. 15-2388-1-1a]
MHHLNARRTFGTIIAPAAIDSFARTSRMPARLHPRRDPEGHPNGGGGEAAGDGGGADGENDGAGADDTTNQWKELFGDQKPEDVKKAVDESRKWENRSKDNFSAKQQLDALMKIVNGDNPDGENDPSKLPGQLTAAQQEARESKLELAVFRRAAKLDGNADRLVDSRSFNRAIAELDPAASDFDEKLDAAIKDAVAADPSLGIPKAEEPGVGVHVEGEGGAPVTPANLASQIAAAEKAGDKQKAMRLKTLQLAQLGTNKK